MDHYDQKRVLVTGACGTVGSQLMRQMLEEQQVGEILGVDNNESELFFLEQKLSSHHNARFILADVRDRDKLCRVMNGVDVVFHTAAFKHVIMCERSPFEAVQTNILGVQNLVYAAIDQGVERVVFTSSDKAVNPTNVMGTSKLMGERLITAANSNLRGNRPILTSTRFGNVLGSKGSVIPIFHEQIRRGGPVTLTDPGMTRFIMSIKEAVSLVINSALLARGGEVFITKMDAINIQDLAEIMIKELAPRYGHDPEKIKIEVIGLKPGEKMYEELMSQEESRRALELSQYFAVLPAFSGIYRRIEYKYEDSKPLEDVVPYHSGNQKPLSQEELARFLVDNDLLGMPEDEEHPVERYWP